MVDLPPLALSSRVSIWSRRCQGSEAPQMRLGLKKRLLHRKAPTTSTVGMSWTCTTITSSTDPSSCVVWVLTSTGRQPGMGCKFFALLVVTFGWMPWTQKQSTASGKNDCDLEAKRHPAFIVDNVSTSQDVNIPCWLDGTPELRFVVWVRAVVSNPSFRALGARPHSFARVGCRCVQA